MKRRQAIELNSIQFKKWFEGIDTFLFDCDGVLWRGNHVIPGTVETIDLLRKYKKKTIFVTNNSSKSRLTYVKKLASFGIDSEIQDIVSSASATTLHLKMFPITGKAYVIGEAGLVEELENCNIPCIGIKDGEIRDIPEPFVVDQDVGAVVIGLDRHISYYKIAYAAVCLRDNPNCRFIATNGDQTFPSAETLLPGAGSFLAALIAASGREPDVIVGKPSKDLATTIINDNGLNPSRTCMVGDRLTTDIAFGRSADLQTLLVFSGVTTKQDLLENQYDQLEPDVYVESLGSIAKMLHELQ